MPRYKSLKRSWRGSIGFLLGEGVHASLLSMGIICALVIVLNGFDVMAAARFADNTLNRMLSAEADRQARFVWAYWSVFASFFSFTITVRAIDRRSTRRAS